MEKSKDSIIINGKRTEAIRYHEIFDQETKHGYLNDEIEELVKVLTARELVDQKSEQGIDFLFRVETEINLEDLQRKFDRLASLVDLAKSEGFTFEPKDEKELSSADVDLATIGIEFDEVRKDSVRRRLKSLEESITTQCAGWLNAEMRRTDQKRPEIDSLRPDIPRVLDETTGHPLTEFSTLLFQEIRLDVRKAYVSVSENISVVINKAKSSLNQRLQDYMRDKRPETAINVAAQLRRLQVEIDNQIEKINREQDSAQQLYNSFEKWRMLARQIERDRLTMADSPKVDALINLCNRLDNEQTRIKRHLADRTKTVNQVLQSHEYFANQIGTIKAEFDDISVNRKDEFIRFQATIEEQFRILVPRPEIGERYNPSDEDGSYRRVRERSAERIRGFSEMAIKRLQELKADLMKPIEVFAVKPSVTDDAIGLRDKISELEIQINKIVQDSDVDSIEVQLSGLVESLHARRKESEELLRQWEKIQAQLRCDRSELSTKAARLLSLIETNSEKDFTELIVALRQSGNSTFSSTAEIIESLEELYQRNWLNIKVSRTTT